MDPVEIDELLKEFLTWPPGQIQKEDHDGFVKDFREALSRLWDDPGRMHVKSMPMFEVVSVSVKPKNMIPTEFGDRPWEIHGVIEATEQGVKYDLYYKPPNDPEMIPRTDSNGISLTLSDEVLYKFIFPEKVKVDLKDGVQDLVKKTLLDYRDYHDYDKVKSEIIEGVHATVCVEYITY